MARLALFLWLIPLGSAQQYTISTVAGIGLLPFGGAGAPAVNAFLIDPNFVAADSAGAIYVADTYYQQVFRIDANGIISIYAGNGQPGYSGDGGPASAAQLSNPSGLATDSAGDLFIADNGNGVVREVTPDGTISTVASVGADGLAVDAAGNLYFTGSNAVRMIDPNGVVSIVAGTGAPGYSGDGGPAIAATLYSPHGLKVDAMGNIYVADYTNNRIRKITPQGIISTVAGNGKAGFNLSGDGAAATAASLSFPTDVAIDAQGNLYIADFSNVRIRMVNPAGIIQTIAGGGASIQDGPAITASLELPYGLAIDNAGNIVVSLTKDKQVRRITPKGAITTIAGVLPTTSAGDNIAATSAPLFDPYGVIADGSGNVYISDFADNRIREISASGIITTFAGDGLFAISPNNGKAVEVGSPHGLAFDGAANLYVSMGDGNIVRRITPQGIVNTVAGAGLSLGDGGSALGAELVLPNGVAVDAAGNLYVAESANNRIRRVDTQGIITTVAGTGTPGYSGDNGPAALAKLYSPDQIALDNNGNLYVADEGNNRIREIAPDGTITTVAGNGLRGSAGNGGAATSARLSAPSGVAVDAAGNLYIANRGNSTIQMVNAGTGVITTIAGNGTAGFSGDGGSATDAQLNGPLSLALDGSGNLYFTDEGNYRVRQLTPGTQ